jgi:hypothetical protein
MKKKLLLAGVVLLAAALAVACIPAEQPWTAWDTGFAAGQTNWTADAPRNPAAESRVLDNHTVDLLWRPNRPNSYLGTSVETDNLGLAVSPGDVLSVHYGITSSNPDNIPLMDNDGAIRFFAYFSERNEDTINSLPDLVAAAPDADVRNGTLELVVPEGVPEGTEIGHAGFVYDTSNGGVQGRVRFSNPTFSDDGSEPMPLSLEG